MHRESRAWQVDGKPLQLGMQQPEIGTHPPPVKIQSNANRPIKLREARRYICSRPMYRFQHPEYLWLLTTVPLLAGLFVWLLLWRSRAVRRLGERSLIADQILGRIPGRVALKGVLMMLSLGIAI